MVSATKDDNVVSLYGSAKEANGQMVRIAVTLSAMTGTPVRIENISASRDIRGQRHHALTCLHHMAVLPPPANSF